MDMKRWVWGTVGGAAAGFLSALTGSAWMGVLFPLPLQAGRTRPILQPDGFIMGLTFITICVPAVAICAIVGGLVGGYWRRKP